MDEDGLFDRSQMEDEAFDPLPPPLSPGQDQGDPFADGDENGEVSKLADVPEAKRKGVKRPQPKLDANRLISDRGLPALRTLFNNVHYKGKGHEAEDLRQLMKMMENWAHRLFPKLQFEDFIDKVERLGSKKEVQTCLKRIRLDMPLTHDDYTNKDGEEEELPPEVQIFGDPDPFGGEHLSNSPLSHLVHSTPAPSANPNPAPLPSSSPPPALTEEQRRRMEENRLKALEKRLARQQQQQQQQTESQPVDSQPVESQPVPPTEDSTDVTSETVPSVSQVQEEVLDLDLEPLISSGSTQQQQQEQSSQPLSQDSESPPSVETTQAENPETRPSPEVHEPEENCEEEGDCSKEEE